MRKGLLVLLSFMLGFAVFIPVSDAQAAPELRVGYVDMQKALASSRTGAKAQDQYKAEVKKAQTALDRKKREYEKRRDDFEKQRGSLSSEAKLGREEELIKIEKDLKRSFQDSQETLRRKNATLVGGLVKELRGVVQKVGEEKGFTIILEKGSQAVLYADNSIDITDDVVKRFDATSR